ncbi:hypothetical protein FH609_019675 [Streptomyces sp. 3MP-14]|uniref:Uncharacterized protein n=1 Tax=Streptomyces mimosae TaxID=2586635 RepID=A0A5N6A791_9ACTN|nr:MULTISPECIES: hypothetical protein [Streptomyces]KAB8163863.1 hypothetical protein FH607_018215 [Streptomyces mimosae]KAB8175306.1 hypothetical protein FH609_019675 [Streptomyces sp. 3MP-14]
MDYVAALFAPTVMAVAFTFLIITIVRSQGGANKYKEDAAVDAALAAANSRPADPDRGEAARSAD